METRIQRLAAMDRVCSGHKFTMEDALEVRALAQLGARVLEILCGSSVTPRTADAQVEQIADAIEALGLLGEKGVER